MKTDGSTSYDPGVGDNMSKITGRNGADSGSKTNSKGESHCFNCGLPSHWAYKCPQLSGEQQLQLHMNLEAQEGDGEQGTTEEGHQLPNIALTEGAELPNDRAYLDGCSTVTAFKNKK